MIDGSAEHTASSNEVLKAIHGGEANGRAARQSFQTDDIDWALKSGNTGLWEWNHATGQIMLSESCLMQFGEHAAATMRPTEFRKLFYPDEVEELFAAIEKFVAGNTDEFRHEFRLGREGAAFEWFRCVGRLLPTADGELKRFQASQVVITSEKMALAGRSQAIQELTAAKSKYETLFDDSPVMHANVSPVNALIIDCNRRLVSTLGFQSKRDIIGKPIFACYHEDCHAEVQRAFQTFVATGSVENVELTLRHTSGKKLPVILNVSSVRDSSGKILSSSSTWLEISSLKKTQAELEKVSEERRVLVDLLGATDGGFHWSLPEREIEFTGGFRELLGFESGDTGRFPNTIEALDTHIHPADRERLWDEIALSHSSAASSAFESEFRIRKLTNEFIWVRLRATTIFAKDGSPLRMAGSIYDIDELKHAERQQEQFLKASVDLFAVVDLATGQWERLSPNWALMLGFPMEELMEIPLVNLCHADDKTIVGDMFTDLASGIKMRDVVVRVRTASGSHRWLEWQAIPPELGDRSCYATARDITDSDHEVLRKVADAVQTVLYVYDIRNHRNVFSNRSVTSLLGYSPQKINAMGSGFLARLTHPEDWPDVQAHFARIAHGTDSETFDIEYRVMHADGAWRTIYSRDSIFKRTPDGEVQQIVGTATQLDDLEVLRRYSSKLEVANSELEQFAYVASHDLKQPLRGIEHLAAWIEEDANELLPETSRTHLRRLRDRVKRMERLLDDLLAYSRIGRRADGPLQQLAVEDLLSAVTAILDLPTDFRFEYVGEVATVACERPPLEQVLRNLIGNAVKHRSSDQGRVVVKTTQQGDWIEFSVQDDGNGIAHEHHQRIFKMFQTLRPRDEIEGSGIGLAICKKIVTHQGGRIWVESELGKGATFVFTWPNKQVQDE